jgi:hypothetical protein
MVWFFSGRSLIAFTGDPDFEADELADRVADYVFYALEAIDHKSDVEPLGERGAAGEGIA